tara:strand:- start:3380 stop:5254 length:1875 start_codon:yes stop_codon:yes gene_type:complete
MEQEDKARTILSDLTVYMKYAKYIPELERKETWIELCQRNMDMHMKKFESYGEDFLLEIEDLYFNYVIPRKVLPSMRSMHFAGKPIEISPNRIYNCAYMPINDVQCFNEAMFLLLGGTGVGYSVQKHHVRELPAIRHPNPQRTRKIVIEDSIMGWADAIKELFRSYTGELTQTPRFIYDDIRPKGARLKTSGGKAPGPAPLRKCLVIIEGMLQNKKDGEQLTTLECHDILCHIADAVLSGGIRRAAMISLFSLDDSEMINCKAGPFWDGNAQRMRANNSAVILRHRIDKKTFGEVWKRIEASGTGEPGIYFTNDKDWGTNPCCEIALRPYQFCNLTEVNVSNIESQQELNDRVKAAAFLGTLQASYTDFHYLRDIWSQTTEKDALLGISMTGLASNKVSGLDITGAVYIAKAENARIASIIDVTPAARLTCIKPSGTASCVLGTSSGIHAWHSPYYIRRIRVNYDEPIAMYLINNHPELMEKDEFSEGYCIALPQKAPKGAITSKDEDTFAFLERVKEASIRWVTPGHTNGQNTHNVSATCYIKDNQWDEVGEWMWLNRHFYNGLSCFPYDETAYAQPPFQECNKETYDKMMQSLKNIDLTQINDDDDDDFSNNPACAGGACDL